MRKRVNLGVFARIPVDAAQAGERVLTVDIHRAGATDTLSAGTTKSQGGINLVFDLDERIQNLARSKG